MNLTTTKNLPLILGFGGFLVWAVFIFNADEPLERAEKGEVIFIEKPHIDYVGKEENKPHKFIDPNLKFRGSGAMVKMESEYFMLSGEQPRIFGNKYFKNVEFSIDYMRIGDDGEHYSGGIVGVRSHEEGHSKKPNEAHTYYFRLKHDQKVNFYKEVVHSGEQKELKSADFEWDSDVWYNIKIRCYNLDEEGRIKLEGYINDILVLEYDDDDKRMNKWGICFVRNTNIAEARYKNIRMEALE